MDEPNDFEILCAERGKALVAALLDVKARVSEAGYSSSYGICGHLSTRLDFDPDIWLEAQFKKWPERSGSLWYPVPDPDGHPETAYDLARGHYMWNPNNAYGAARLRLLDFLITQAHAGADFAILGECYD